MPSIGHHYRRIVDFIPWPKSRNKDLPRPAASASRQTTEGTTQLADRRDFPRFAGTAGVVFTGDLTHTTEDPKERRARMKRLREIAGELHVKDIRFMPGEHDASLDKGEAYKEFFGDTQYTSATRTTRSTTRACPSSRSTMSPIPARSWATPGPQPGTRRRLMTRP